MWICKICRTANIEEGRCRKCGFDPSTEYETYPTLAPFDCTSVKSIAEATDAFLSSVSTDLSFCDACGGSRFYFSSALGKLICCDCGKETVLRFDHSGNDRKSAMTTVPLSIGFNHVVGIKKDGSVVVIGNNFNSQCDVESFRNVRAVSAGFLNTLCLMQDGKVASAGFGEEEKATIDSWEHIVSVAAGKGFGAGLRDDGTVCISTETLDYLKEVRSWTNVVSITASNRSLYGIRSDGTVLSCQKALPSKIFSSILNWKDIISITANDACVFGLKQDGTVVSTVRLAGAGVSGALAEISEWRDIKSISASTNQLVGLKKDGTVMAASISGGSLLFERQTYPKNFIGNASSFGMKAMSKWQDIKAVYAGETFTLGIQNDGSVLIAGITTFDKQLSGWKDMLLPDE